MPFIPKVLMRACRLPEDFPILGHSWCPTWFFFTKCPILRIIRGQIKSDVFLPLTFDRKKNRAVGMVPMCVAWRDTYVDWNPAWHSWVSTWPYITLTWGQGCTLAFYGQHAYVSTRLDEGNRMVFNLFSYVSFSLSYFEYLFWWKPAILTFHDLRTQSYWSRLKEAPTILNRQPCAALPASNVWGGAGLSWGWFDPQPFDSYSRQSLVEKRAYCLWSGKADAIIYQP